VTRRGGAVMTLGFRPPTGVPRAKGSSTTSTCATRPVYAALGADPEPLVPELLVLSRRVA
jgi:hypothetical protein